MGQSNTDTMGDIPPLGGLSVNAPPGPPPPSVRDLPPELIDEVLASYLARLDVGELCQANLLQICMAFRGTNQCNDPDDPLWKAACARFGLTERLVGGLPGAPATPTWHVTFLAMCKEVAMLEPDHRATYKGLLRGDDTYEDGPFSGDDDSDDDDGYVTFFTAPPQRRLRIAVVQLWLHAVFGGLFCMMHYLLRRVDGIVHDGNDRALRLASVEGHAAAVEVLLAHGADVNASDRRGRSALREASENGHLAVVEVLLAHGADVHAFDDAALHWASRYGHAAVVEVLLAHGANVHAYTDVALRAASTRGHTAVVELLLAHGADVHADNDRALRSASIYGRAAVVEALLAHGADVHTEGDEALRHASQEGHAAVVEILLAHGANVHARQGAALRAARYNDRTAVVEVLLAAGATGE